jgi:hypothetical protein
MAATDKIRLTNRLQELGWTIALGPHWRMIPPDSLWENKPESFDIYDARDIEGLLGDQSMFDIEY